MLRNSGWELGAECRWVIPTASATLWTRLFKLEKICQAVNNYPFSCHDQSHLFIDQIVKAKVAGSSCSNTMLMQVRPASAWWNSEMETNAMAGARSLTDSAVRW
jgi:hypothetical protein